MSRGGTAAVAEDLVAASGDRRRYELRHVAAEGGDLLDAAGRYEAVVRPRHHVDGLELGRERPVEVAHLELPFEVGDGAQPLDHRARAAALGEVHDQIAKGLDGDVVDTGQSLLEKGDPCLLYT